MSANSIMPEDGRGNDMPVLSFRTTKGTANTFASTVTTSAVRLGPFSENQQILNMNIRPGWRLRWPWCHTCVRR